MVLVVGVEDDAAVGGEAGGHGRPPGLEAGGVGDDGAVVPAEVVRVYDGVGSSGAGLLVGGLVCRSLRPGWWAGGRTHLAVM